MNQTIEQQIAENGFYVSTTVGVSMRPMLRNRRDRVIIRSTEGKRLSKWDLPLYKRQDGKYILHRIIEVRDGYYVIRGDNTYVKEKIPDERIVGVMTEFYRGKRHVLASDRGYRRYAAFWQTIYPLRLPFHWLHRAASFCKHRVLCIFGKRQPSNGT